jgi:O-antigen/teichoic acid export membrane protein
VTTLKKLTAYYVAMGAAGLINVGKNLIYAKILGPEGLGFYSLSILLSTFAMYVCSGGLYEGAMGVFPMMYGAGRDEEVRRLRNIASGQIVLLSTALLATGAAVSLAIPFKSGEFRNAAVLGIAFAGAQVFFVFVLADLRSRMLTSQFGYFILVRSVLSLFFGFLAARQFGFTGILLSETVIPLILSVFAIKWGTQEFRLRLARPAEVRPLLRVGLPLMVNGLATTTAANMDKFFIVGVLGTGIFGQYSFAMLLVTGSMMIQAIIYQHVGPLILYRIGGGTDPVFLLHKLDRYVIIALAGLLALWYPLASVVRAVVEKFFPQYHQAVPIFVILYLGACFILISHFEHFIVALKKTELIVILNLAVIVLVTVLLWLGLVGHKPLSWFAGVFVAGRAASVLGLRALAGWAVSRLRRDKGVEQDA